MIVGTTLPMRTPHLLFLIPALISTEAFSASLLNDFSSSPFTAETIDTQWAVGGGTYNNTAPATTATSASFSLAGISGSDFTLSTQFTVSTTTTAPTGGVSTVGFGLLGLDSSFSGSSSGGAYYLADFGYANGMGNQGLGRLRVIAIGDSATGITTGVGSAFDNTEVNYAIQTGSTYTLKLTGTYSGGTLSMVLGLYDAAGTTQIGTSGSLADTTPLAGNNFGYRNRADTGGTTDLSFDNYALQSVPEPSVFALMVPAIALLARRRTRAGR